MINLNKDFEIWFQQEIATTNQTTEAKMDIAPALLIITQETDIVSFGKDLTKLNKREFLTSQFQKENSLEVWLRRRHGINIQSIQVNLKKLILEKTIKILFKKENI